MVAMKINGSGLSNVNLVTITKSVTTMFSIFKKDPVKKLNALNIKIAKV
jgi:hypothetical protein